MPTTGCELSATFIQTLPLPVRHDAVEQLLLCAGVVEVVVDDVVTQCLTRDRAFLQRGYAFPQARREALRVRDIRVPLERRRQLEPVLDPVETRSDRRREREVRVHVAARNARLDPHRRARPDDPEAAGAIVAPPGE